MEKSCASVLEVLDGYGHVDAVETLAEDLARGGEHDEGVRSQLAQKVLHLVDLPGRYDGEEEVALFPAVHPARGDEGDAPVEEIKINDKSDDILDFDFNSNSNDTDDKRQIHCFDYNKNNEENSNILIKTKNKNNENINEKLIDIILPENENNKAK